MSVALRVLLIAVSLLTLIYMVRRIRKSGLKISYSIFWIVVSVILLILSIFPSILIGVAKLIGIESPANLIYLIAIFILLIHSFYMTIKTSHLEDMIQNLTEEIAISKTLRRDKEEDKKNQG